MYSPVIREKLAEALEEVENANSAFLIDQIAYYIGNFSERHGRLSIPYKKGGKIEQLLPEMKETTFPQAMLAISHYRNDVDLRGQICDLLIRWLSD